MKCSLCKQRTAKRHCPSVRKYICAICCGTEREVSLDCPLDCVYLQEAYRHEMERAEPPKEPPYAAHQVPDEFLREKEPFIGSMALTLLRYSLANPGVWDADLRAVLDALVRTYETLSSGLLYETLPEGPLRVSLYRELQKFVEEWREEEEKKAAFSLTQDGDVLRSLVFLGRLAQAHNNQRPRGRSFVAFLRRTFPEVVARQSRSLIIPGR